MICGWSPQGDEILRELHDDEVVDKTPVAIVAPLPSTPTDDDLTTFIRGVPSDVDALRRAGIDRASSAIVLADVSNATSGPDERDAMTLLSALAVESLNPDVQTCVEVLRSDNLQHFRRANVDEVVVSAEIAGHILAASAKTPGMSSVIDELTGHGRGSEFYVVEAPASLDGEPFHAALARVKVAADALLVGVGADGIGFDVNPPAERTIATRERLLLISADDPTERLRRALDPGR